MRLLNAHRSWLSICIFLSEFKSAAHSERIEPVYPFRHFSLRGTSGTHAARWPRDSWNARANAADLAKAHGHGPRPGFWGLEAGAEPGHGPARPTWPAKQTLACDCRFPARSKKRRGYRMPIRDAHRLARSTGGFLLLGRTGVAKAVFWITSFQTAEAMARGRLPSTCPFRCSSRKAFPGTTRNRDLESSFCCNTAQAVVPEPCGSPDLIRQSPGRTQGRRW